jgi:hypothetical protein
MDETKRDDSKTTSISSSVSSPIDGRPYQDINQSYIIGILRGIIISLADSSSSICSLSTSRVILPHLINIVNHRAGIQSPHRRSPLLPNIIIDDG